MASSKLSIIRKVIWPERASLFVIVGGAAGLIGDITGFFSELVSPVLLIGISGVVAVLASLLCLQRAFLIDPSNEQAVAEVVDCRVCDAMRFGLFAFAAFLLLFAIGKDKSATEAIASKLGLIHEDVKQIGADVGDIRQGVGEINDVVESQKIISNPETARDYFRNAWIYSYIQRDSVRSYESLQKMYAKTDVRMLDAADLFYNMGVQVVGRAQVLKEMEETGLARKDPSLLVIAARNASSVNDGDALLAKAIEIDPDYPFAYWDVMRFSAIASATAPEPSAQRAMMEKQVAGLEKFIAAIDAHPTSHYFFLPQYQPDYSSLARQNLESNKRNVENYKRMEEQMRKIGR